MFIPVFDIALPLRLHDHIRQLLVRPLPAGPVVVHGAPQRRHVPAQPRKMLGERHRARDEAGAEAELLLKMFGNLAKQGPCRARQNSKSRK